jgi:hypothetical protein
MASEEKFNRYDELNPEIWKEFEKIALNLITKYNRKRYSAYAIMEIIRYHTVISGASGDDEFKVNNDYRSWYARKFVNVHPEHKGFFELRSKQAEN